MKTKLTEDLSLRIVEDIKLGLTYRDACKLNGICEDSFYEWLKRGKNDIKKNKITVFSEFSESVEQAVLDMKKICLEVIRETLKSKTKDGLTIIDPNMAKWYLSVRFKKEYGKDSVDGDDLDSSGSEKTFLRSISEIKFEEDVEDD